MTTRSSREHAFPLGDRCEPCDQFRNEVNARNSNLVTATEQDACKIGGRLKTMLWRGTSGKEAHDRLVMEMPISGLPAGEDLAKHKRIMRVAAQCATKMFVSRVG